MFKSNKSFIIRKIFLIIKWKVIWANPVYLLHWKLNDFLCLLPMSLMYFLDFTFFPKSFPWNIIVTHWNRWLIRYGSFFVQWLTYINVEIKLIAVQLTIYFPSYALQLVLITVIQYVYLKRILTYNKNNLFVKAMPWARKQCKYFFVAWHVARCTHST